MPTEHRARIEHARRLHHLWHGAPLLYNLMLSRLCRDDERVDHYEGELDRWDEEIEESQVLRTPTVHCAAGHDRIRQRGRMHCA